MKSKTLTFIFACCSIAHCLSQTNSNVLNEKNDLEKYFNIDISEVQRNEIKKEIDSFNVKIASDSTNSALFTERGFCYAKLGLHVFAIHDYNKAIMLDKANSNAYYLRGSSKNRFFITKSGCNDIKTASEYQHQEAEKEYEIKCGRYQLDDNNYITQQ